MGLEAELRQRSGEVCELCGATEKLKVYEVPPVSMGGVDGSLLGCATCLDQVANPDIADPHHWRCLNDSMWSEHGAVKVVAWRMLWHLKAEGWPKEVLDIMYLEEHLLEWAKATGEGLDESEKIIHRDANGTLLENGDNVVLIKDLKVKGSSLVAKQGTAVRKITVDRDNADYIEGRVEGQQIVIITKYVKKI